MIKRILYYFIVFLLVTFLLSLWLFYNGVRPFKLHSSITPLDYHLEYKKIKLQTKDGLMLDAWYIPAMKKTKKTIILLHGYGADKGNILPSRIFLHAYYNLLLLDFRYFGESEGSYSTVGGLEVQDLLAAVSYLQGQGMNNIGVWGLSMGAAVALVAASESSMIKAVVAESSYASLAKMADEFYFIPGYRYILGKLMRMWGMLILDIDVNAISPMNSVKRVTVPVMLIHSKADTHIAYENAILLKNSLKHNNKVEYLIFDDAPHGWIDRNTQLKIKNFFEKNL